MSAQSSVLLPQEIRKQIAKLPGPTRDVVAQSLRRAPPPPVIYEEACKQLALIHDPKTLLHKGLLAADALALYGRMYDDNRALIEAQKIKMFALRQMYKCAAELGHAKLILIDKKIPHNRIATGESLCSYQDKQAMDSAADHLANKGRIDWLVGRVDQNSPLRRNIYAGNMKIHAEQKRAAELAEKSPDGVFNNASSSLSTIKYNLQAFLIDKAPVLNRLPNRLRGRLRNSIIEIQEVLDAIDQQLGLK